MAFQLFCGSGRTLDQSKWLVVLPARQRKHVMKFRNEWMQASCFMAWLGSRLKSFESVEAHHTVMHSITGLKIGQNHHHWSYNSWFSGQDSSGSATYSQVQQKSATKDDWEVCEVRSAKWEVRVKFFPRYRNCYSLHSTSHITHHTLLEATTF